MLRKRSRTVTTTSNQASSMGSDNGYYLSSPRDKFIKPTPPLISPRLLFSVSNGLLSETDNNSSSLKSPTSILDNKPFFANPFSTSSSTTKSWEKKVESGIGLGILDALLDDEKQPNQKSSSRMVLFGSQLKIQIPPLVPTASPSSTDFGINTPIHEMGCSSQLFSPSEKTPRVFTGCLSASEMESSEDYTCVITHGPNPRTTHIFDNCIVKDCCGVVGFSSPKKVNVCLSEKSEDYPSKNFLSFCHTCKKHLEQGKDIYIYRGEKAFCSHECRNEEILLDEGREKSGLDCS
ncbi:hypothetical protein MKW94_013580 [Papaver nudicaule]|uniref:FLZ-type domain-containing protein n=1 Tax=Papaver nudicaule TaxID=74823 RepID=A0AA41VST2_PAPNU|nr:hypothetical protein [Papaver nudicaule]